MGQAKGTGLVVDASPGQRAAMAQLLAADGFAVATAADEEQLRQLLMDAAPDCVLLKADLTGADGCEVCRWLKADPARCRIPVVLVTGASEDKGLGLEAGADDFLSRSCSSAELLARVRSLVRVKRTQDQVAQVWGELAERNRLWQAELAVASQVQHSLLPDALPGTAFWSGALYLPAGEIGGDFYDCRELEGDRLGVLMADVEGHGVSAALVTALLKVMFHHLPDCQDPAAVLGQLNAQLLAFLPGAPKAAPAVTAQFALLDPQGGRVGIACAGHPPAILLQGQTPFPIGAPGFPLGWFSTGEYRTEVMTMDADDRLLLYTDGVLEVFGDNGGAGSPDRMAAFLRSAGRLDGPRLLQRLDHLCRRQRRRGHQQDDMTAMVIERRPRNGQGA